MNMLAAIMTEPDFAEVMFFVAFVLFVIEVILCIARPAGWVYSGLILALGLAAVALASWPCDVSGCDPRPRRLSAVAARRRPRRPTHRVPRAATVIHSRRRIAATIIAILALCLGGPAAVIAVDGIEDFGDIDVGVVPAYPGNCSTKQPSSRTAAAYCRSMDNNDGYQVRGKRNTWQGVVTFGGNWADASDENGSYYTAPSGSTIVSGSLWVQKADCCFHPF